MALEIVDTYTAGQTSPKYSRNFGAGLIDITGWTFTLEQRRADGSWNEVVGVIDDAAAGDYSFTFAAGDLIEGKNQETQIRVVKITTDTGTEVIGPILFTVRDDPAT